MTQYEIYVFFLCLVVFILLTTLSVVCLSIITKLTVRLIRIGAEDDNIIKEYNDRKKAKPNKFLRVLERVLSTGLCLVLLLSFITSLSIGASQDNRFQTKPAYRVVNTGSMSKKHEKNTYLKNINNQLQTFDLIRTEPLPSEFDLELYDIVVYEVDDMFIVHRIIEIEEPNAYHPDCRYFRLQGDNVEAPDRFPVLYGQMRAIYKGDRIPFIGSLVLFLQSPAGWLCILLCLIAIIASPILDKKLKEERDNRLAFIKLNSSEVLEEKEEEFANV